LLLAPPDSSLARGLVKRRIKGRGRPLNVLRLKELPHITERLASRVKGLTALFRVLLLTNPARTRRPVGFQSKGRGCGKKSYGGRPHEFFKR
jgi:hypothetical protein